MYMYMYMYIYRYIYVYIHACIHICIFTYMHIYIYTYVYVYIYMHCINIQPCIEIPASLVPEPSGDPSRPGCPGAPSVCGLQNGFSQALKGVLMGVKRA